MINRLEQSGAQPILFSTINIVPTRDWTDCDEAIAALSKWNGFIFTSANSVRCFMDRLSSKISSYRDILRKRCIYVVGQSTQEALAAYGICSICFDTVQDAESLVHALSKKLKAKGQYLFLSGILTEDTIEKKLALKGITVRRVVVYKTEFILPENTLTVRHAFQTNQIDMVTFFSPSSITNFIRIIPLSLLKNCKIAVIGNTTAHAASIVGLSVDLIPPRPTADELVASIEKYYEHNP